jgi:hypothetical protein
MQLHIQQQWLRMMQDTDSLHVETVYSHSDFICRMILGVQLNVEQELEHDIH